MVNDLSSTIRRVFFDRADAPENGGLYDGDEALIEPSEAAWSLDWTLTGHAA